MRTIGASWLAAVTTAVTVVVATPASADDGSGDDTSVLRRVVVSIPDRKLALIENDQIVRIYPVAVGAAASPSPSGTFNVVTRVTNPTYYAPGKVVEPGSTNPVGTRWIGLSLKGFGIHGTDNPQSIGFARSHGCIRLRNEDVEQLFDLAEIDGSVIGTAVIDGIPHIAADEHGVVPEVTRHFRRHVRSRAHGHHVHDLDIFHVRTALHERFDQRFRFRAARLNVNPHPRLDAAQRIFSLIASELNQVEVEFERQARSNIQVIAYFLRVNFSAFVMKG
jgi:hypothetical protein